MSHHRRTVLGSALAAVALTVAACANVDDAPALETTHEAIHLRPGHATWGVVLGALADRSAGPVNLTDRADAVACDIDQMGMGWVRVDVGNGSGDLTPFQRFITAAHARHVSVLLVLHPANFHTTSVDVQTPAADLQRWLDGYIGTLTQLVDHTFVGTSMPDAYEIGNEPNGGQSDITAGAFAVLLDRVWTQVRNTRLGHIPRIVSGGTYNFWINQPWWQSFFYHLRLMHQMGHSMPFDVFGIHPYNGDTYRDHGAQAWSDSVVSNIDALNASLTGIYGFHPPLWATEVGWSSSDKRSNGADYGAADDTAPSEAQQAALFERADDTLAGRVENAFWYDYRDDEGGAGSEYNNFGIRQNSAGNYTAKAIYSHIAARTGGGGNASVCYATTTSSSGGAPTTPPAGGSSGALTFDHGDAQRTASTGDWQPGAYKAECGGAQAVTGLSLAPGSDAAHSALCSVDAAPRYPHAACRTVNFHDRDGRGAGESNDWDRYYVKGECNPNEYVAGISQTTDHHLESILCCAGAVAHNSCAARVMAGQDARESGASSDDWARGYYKGECGAGRYVAGVSHDAASGAPHALYCCAAQ